MGNKKTKARPKLPEKHWQQEPALSITQSFQMCLQIVPTHRKCVIGRKRKRLRQSVKYSWFSIPMCLHLWIQPNKEKNISIKILHLY